MNKQLLHKANQQLVAAQITLGQVDGEQFADEYDYEELCPIQLILDNAAKKLDSLTTKTYGKR